jgi:hypothetical protein
MKQPKYKIGDKFSKTEELNYKGSKHNLCIVGFVTSIKQIYGDPYDDVSYKYGLSSTCTYFDEGRVEVEVISELNIDKVWKHEE